MNKNDTYEKRYNYYKGLLDLTYAQIVQSLIEKYGEVLDEYYREKSYQRYLNEEIKSIARGKYSRAKEGLYCHHILENTYENISSEYYIAHFKYPHEYHRKENLVYCDLIEHLILHAIITKETNGKYGVKGLCTVIKPMVKDWYIGEYNPKKEWMQVAKKKSHLPKEYISKLFIDIDKILNNVEKYQEFEEREKRAEEEIKEIKLKRENEIEEYMQILSISKEEFENNEQLIKDEEHRYANQHNIFEIIVDKKAPRKKVLGLLRYYERLNVPSRNFGDEYDSLKLNTLKDDLIEELRELSKQVVLKLENAKYYKEDVDYNIDLTLVDFYDIEEQEANILL